MTFPVFFQRLLRLVLAIIFPHIALFSQPELANLTPYSDQFQMNGYVKELATFNITNDSITFNNLFHNRFNFKWFTTDKITLYLEFRNRLFAGNNVKYVPDYDKAIDANNDYFDLSVQGPKDGSWLFQTMIDRAYVEWYQGQWEIRAGRQRINWGVNLIWNPHDLFNAYSFFDFDYEERPGSDAVRIKKYIGFASSFELAANYHANFDQVVMAAMWKTNRWGYDFQFIAGKAQKDLTVGTGWAGNIGDAGFKGEVTYFKPYTDQGAFSNTLLASVSIDYSFENSLYLHSSILYNSDGSEARSLEGLTFGNTGRLTVRDLSPFEYAIFLQTTYNFHPLISGGLATIYYPGNRHAMFLNPSVTISLKSNLDLNLLGQLYFDQPLGTYEALARLIYVRAKWSF